MAHGDDPVPESAAGPEGDAPAPVVGANGDAASREPRHRAEVTRKRRRVTTGPVPGSDPTPQSEPPRHAENENDERLKQDKPPHWG